MTKKCIYQGKTFNDVIEPFGKGAPYKDLCKIGCGGFDKNCWHYSYYNEDKELHFHNQNLKEKEDSDLIEKIMTQQSNYI
jgi:hypothetical protein